jgi:two-component system, cell cycle response regulator
MISRAEILSASILVVDDRDANVSLLEQILAEDGYTRVTTTTNSMEVCALHERNHYDLIVLDLQMPGMDGFQVMEGLKTGAPEGYLPVIVLTAQPALKLRAFQAGARDFISKPFELIDVKTRVYNMLEVQLLYKKLEDYNRVLERKTLRDSRTGLPNRELFDDRLAHTIALAKRHTWMLAVMFIDLNGLKFINDTHGHAMGDEVLKVVARRLLEHARDEDTVCRNGGDEFLCLLLNPQGSDDIEHIVGRLLKTIEQPIVVGDVQSVITASIGIAVYPANGDSAEQLNRNADIAMYRAKKDSRGYAFFAEHEMEQVESLS